MWRSSGRLPAHAPVAIPAVLVALVDLVGEGDEVAAGRSCHQNRPDLEGVEHPLEAPALARLYREASHSHTELAKRGIEHPHRCRLRGAKPCDGDERRLLVDVAVMVDLVQLVHARLSRVRLHALFERGVDPGRAKLQPQQRERQLRPPQSHADDRNAAFLAHRHEQRPGVIERRRRPGELDDVGIELGRLVKQRLNVGLRAIRPRERDDPLHLPEPRNLAGDIDVELDVGRPRDNRLTQQHQPRIFGPFPLPSVLLAAAGDDDWLLDRRQQVLDIRLLFEVIETEFNDISMPGGIEQINLGKRPGRGGNRYTDHADRPLAGGNGFRAPRSLRRGAAVTTL